MQYMNRQPPFITIIIFLLFPFVQCCGALPEGADRILPQIIVQGKVISIEHEGIFVKGKIKILHVYKGPKNLIDKVFTARSCEGETDAKGDFTPEFKKGEMGIWPLDVYKKDIYYSPYSDSGGSVPFLYSAARSVAEYGIITYDRAKEVAEAIEKFDKIHKGRKVDFLKKFVNSKNPLLSDFAVRFLGLIGNEENFKFLRKEITLGRPSFYGETVIDKILTENSPSWSKSEDRKKVFKKWVTQKIPIDSTVKIAYRNAFQQIWKAFKKGCIKERDFYILSKSGIENETIPIYSRSGCISSLSSIYNTVTDKDIKTEIFNKIILIIIKESEESKLKSGAIYSIRYMSLSNEEIKRLKELSKEITDEKLKKIIDKIIKTNMANKVKDE